MQSTDEFSFILKTSPIGGSGVFALHDIAEGVLLKLVPDGYVSRLLHESEIPEELKMYCVAKDNDMWTCPAEFNRMELSWHLNHSVKPNAQRKGKGIFCSIKEIIAGEEIVINYNSLGEPEEKKEEFYKK